MFTDGVFAALLYSVSSTLSKQKNAGVYSHGFLGRCVLYGLLACYFYLKYFIYTR